MSNKKQDKDNTKYLNVILETACAEFGSALEMLKACKDSTKKIWLMDILNILKMNIIIRKLSYQYSKFGKLTNSNTSRNYRFSTNSVLTKGYVARDGYLIEKMKLKTLLHMSTLMNFLLKNHSMEF